MSPRVFFYVQHLLGIGHLKRAAALVNAMTRAGLEVTVASGGAPVPTVAFDCARFVQLPPATSADASFKNLIDESGRPIDEAWKAERRARLLAAWREARAQALVIELYPFGRRQMRFELLPLLDAVPGEVPRPLVICSVRDVLGGTRDAARQAEQLALFERYYDHLLVHGDPEFIDFGRTFALVDKLGARLHYTGYVVDSLPGVVADAPSDTSVADAESVRAGVSVVGPTGALSSRLAASPASRAESGDAGYDEVLVSAGGGAVGAELMLAAIRARPLTALANHTWRLLTGVNIPDEDFAAVQALAEELGDGRVVVERSRPDFVQRLGRCRLSISQAGYNTLMEILQAGARAVVVPFAAGAETEQTLRAELLADRGLIALVRESGLTPETLAAGVARALALAPAADCPVRLDGARRSAALIAAWLADRHGTQRSGASAAELAWRSRA